MTEEELEDATANYLEQERKSDLLLPAADHPEQEKGPKSRKMMQEIEGRMVDVVLSDMSEPWEQTTGFWKKSLSDPYHRMMNTSGMNFRDHVGSMV